MFGSRPLLLAPDGCQGIIACIERLGSEPLSDVKFTRILLLSPLNPSPSQSVAATPMNTPQQTAGSLDARLRDSLAQVAIESHLGGMRDHGDGNGSFDCRRVRGGACGVKCLGLG